MTPKIVIIDTGCANISSVKFALQRLGVAVTVSDEPAVIKASDKAFLPGVGSAQNAMQSIRDKGLVETIQSLTQPTLGVCLGMQLMTEVSHESGLHSTDTVACLGLIPGSVERMQVGTLRLPHMGWNTVNPTRNPLFQGITHGTHFYFVHSYAVPVYEHTLASCEYGQAFSAAIHKDNFYGVQFHPERSGDAGAQLLENFVKL
ncbi:MAG: imidazole glycerol phosphate synthase subunit HisH [Glaciecola sp.]|jgi:glutamine amidotransferase